MSRIITFAIALHLLSLSLFAHSSETQSYLGLGPGVVVEDVEPGSDGEKAGLQKGDVILSWARQDRAGKVESPFDLFEIGVEQMPRGGVTLAGVRGDKNRSWILDMTWLGVRARPNFQGGFLGLYLEASTMAAGDKLAEAAEQWRIEPAPLWVRLWLLSKAADAFAKEHQWKEADDVYELMLQETGLRPPIRVQLLWAWAAAYNQRRDWLNAEKLYRQSLAESQKTAPESLIVAATFVALGETWRQIGDLAKADEYDHLALEIQEKLIPGSFSTGRILYSLGSIAYQRRDFAQQEKYYRAAFDLTHELAARNTSSYVQWQFAAIVYGLGLVAHSKGDPAKAEKYYVQALAVIQTLAPASLSVAGILSNLGLVTMQQGDLAKAEEYCAQALALRQKLDPGSLDVAASLGSSAAVALQKGDLAKAEEYYRQALEINRKLDPESVRTIIIYDGLGDVAYSQGEPAKAEQYYHQALDINRKLAPGGLGVADDCRNIGNIAILRGDPAKAEEYYGQALDILRKMAPKGSGVANVLKGLGDAAFSRSDLTKAEQYFRQSLEIRQELAPGSVTIADSLGDLAAISQQRGDLEQAEQYYRQALALRQKFSPRTLGVAESLDSLGYLSSLRGNLAEAEEYYNQAFDIRQSQSPGGLGTASSLDNLGDISRQHGDLVKAEQYYRQSLKLREKLAPGSILMALSLGNLGDIAFQREDLERAERYYRQSLEIRQGLVPRSLDVAWTFENLGAVILQRGDAATAERYNRQSLEIRQKLGPGNLGMASVFSNLGDVFRDRGDLAQAENYYRQAFDLQQKTIPESIETAVALKGLGTVAKDRGDLARAEEYYRRASAIQGKLAPESLTYGELLADLAGIMQQNGQHDAASQLYEQSLNIFEHQTAHLGGAEEIRSRFRAKLDGHYKKYIHLLVQQNQPELALEVLERSRGRSWLELLALAHLNIRKGVDPILVERERAVQADITAKADGRLRILTGNGSRGQVTAIDRELDRLLAQYRDIEVEIRATSPAYAALTQPLPISTKEVEQLLDADSLLLEYALGDERSYVFAVTSDSVAAYELPRKSEIEALARQVYQLWTAQNRSFHEESALKRQARLRKAEKNSARVLAELSRVILAPVAGKLKGKRLFIVSDGGLQFIPFAALLSPDSPERRVPMVMEHDIMNLPSASLLATLRREAATRKKAPKAVAILADPVFSKNDERVFAGAAHRKQSQVVLTAKHSAKKGSEEAAVADSAAPLMRSAGDLGLLRRGEPYLPRLLFSRREAQAILSITPKGQGMEALDFRASRATAVSSDLSQYRVLHFATHGLLNSEHPELSGLVLSLVDPQGRPQGGFLGLEDIYNLNLSADLVVLSACETALGKDVHGEGLVGLTRGFMYAGASQVVASLWSVNDAATAELMRLFYKAMEQDGLRPAAALRRAQIQLRKERRWSQPYYWAGFVIQGNGE